MKVLVVDDDEDYIQYLIKLFRRYGATVFFARNGDAALGILDEINVDMVFSDIVLPTMGGIELAKELDHKYPIYLITGMYKGPLFLDMKLYADAVYFKDSIDKYLIRDIVKLYSVEAA